MLMSLNRDHVLASTTGLSIHFLKDVPTHVPPKLVREVVSLGGVASDTDKVAVEQTMAEINASQVEKDAREPTITACIKKMLERNQRGDFTAASRPNLNVIYHETGLRVDALELEPIWTKVREAMQ